MFADQHGAELLYEHYDATVLDDTAMYDDAAVSAGATGYSCPATNSNGTPFTFMECHGASTEVYQTTEPLSYCSYAPECGYATYVVLYTQTAGYTYGQQCTPATTCTPVQTCTPVTTQSCVTEP